MSKEKKIEKQIDILKYWLSVFVISELGLVSWLVSNYNKNHPLYYLGVCLFVGIIIIICYIQRKISKKINELEDL